MNRSWPVVALASIVSSLASYAVLPAEAHAQEESRPKEESWRKLGDRTVNGKIDKDVVQVGGEEGVFTAIRVKVEGSALEMYDVKVVFGNGESFSPNTRLVFGKGGATRVIDLPGNRRAIRRVELKYGNLPGGGRARVELWGKTASEPARPAIAKLGERKVSGRIDKDTIHVGADDGRFTAIQVKVEASAIELYDIKVVFGNGESFSPNTRLVFGKGTSTRMIDLPGNKRVIKRVEFRYGNVRRDAEARIELWGKR